jgi:GNAT superfamily N-acetyltransferase
VPKSRSRKPSGDGNQRAPITASALLRGLPAPNRCRIRLAQAADVPAAARLLTFAEPTLDEEAELLGRSPWMAKGLLSGLNNASDGVLRHTMQALREDGTRGAFLSMSILLVAVDDNQQIQASLLALPPARVLHDALDKGVDILNVLVAAQAIVKLKGVAVSPAARGSGIGSAMIRRCVQLYRQLGWHVVYGQFDAAGGLDSYYSARGFEVLDRGQALNLEPLLGFPLGIYTRPQERLFVRWQ